jgi:hypothetical protein
MATKRQSFLSLEYENIFDTQKCYEGKGILR